VIYPIGFIVIFTSINGVLFDSYKLAQSLPCMGRSMKTNIQLLTVEEVAKYLNVNRFTVYRLVTQKQIPAFKVGGQWRFKKETIEAWLMQSAKNSPDEFSESQE
jgi:excisionase family DNA binding protein